MTRYTSSRVAAALFFLLSSTASSFIVPNTNNYYHHPSARPSAALHATTEDFQRSLLAAQIANNSNKPNSSPTKSITAPQPSVDYDAAARLAYESSGSTDDFSTFKLKYLQDTSNLVATKQRTRIAKEKAAEMKEKAMKAAEAAKVAKEKAQMKIREREDALAKENEVQPVDVVVEETVDTPEPTITATTTTTVEETPISTTTTTTESTTGARVPRELAIVPINDSTIQFTAGALGLTAGLVLGGPILAIFLSATANYLSRKDDAPLQSNKDNDNDSAPTVSTSSPKRIVDAASQTALYLYNFLAQFERDNKIVDSTLQLLESSISTAKKQSSETGETITKIESTLGDLTKSAQTLNDQYDLVGGAGTVLNTVGDLVEDSVDRVIDLNEQFRLTERVGGVVTGAVKKVTEKKD